MLSDILWRGAFHRQYMTIGGRAATPARTAQPDSEFRFPARPAINTAETQMVAHDGPERYELHARRYAPGLNGAVPECTHRPQFRRYAPPRRGADFRLANRYITRPGPCAIAHSVSSSNALPSKLSRSRLGGIMSARNGQRARFHLNRKRRVVQRMRLRAVLLALKEQKAATAADAACAASRSGRPGAGGELTWPRPRMRRAGRRS